MAYGIYPDSIKKIIYGTGLAYMDLRSKDMNAKKARSEEDKQWENPVDPEKPVDDRDAEKITRQYKEAKRRKQNLTETDHIDKKKTNN